MGRRERRPLRPQIPHGAESIVAKAQPISTSARSGLMNGDVNFRAACGTLLRIECRIASHLGVERRIIGACHVHFDRMLQRLRNRLNAKPGFPAQSSSSSSSLSSSA
jgi:hypothetical protein